MKFQFWTPYENEIIYVKSDIGNRLYYWRCCKFLLLKYNYFYYIHRGVWKWKFRKYCPHFFLYNFGNIVVHFRYLKLGLGRYLFFMPNWCAFLKMVLFQLAAWLKSVNIGLLLSSTSATWVSGACSLECTTYGKKLA